MRLRKTKRNKSKPFKFRNGGSPVWSVTGLLCSETWVGNVKVLWHTFASFWLPWVAFGPHFGSLGASWGGFLAQVGPSWPKITKKIDFLNLIPGFGHQVGTQVGTQVGPRRSKIEAEAWKKRCWKTTHFRHRFWKGSGLVLEGFWGRLFKGKLTKIAKTRF